MIDKTNNGEVLIQLPPQKVIFCDIDGTLFDEKNNIHEHTSSKISDLLKNNADFHFSLASGRPLSDEILIYNTLNIKHTGFLIGCNGAQIYALKTHQLIQQKTISQKEANLIFERIKKLQEINNQIALLVNYADNTAYLFNLSQEKFDAYTYGKIKLRNEFSAEDALMFSIFFLKEYEEETLKYLQTLDLTVFPGSKLMAVTAKDISKATAIKYIVQKYHLEMQNIAVIGDSRNDLCMFELPNVFSITYKDAKKYLKDIASVVIDQPKSQFIASGIIEFENYLKK